MTTSRSGSKIDTPEFKRIASYYNVPDVSNVRKAFLLISDTFNDWLVSNGKRDYDEIIPRLFLGRIPCEDGLKLPSTVKMVVSVVEYQEMAGLGLRKTVKTPKKYEEEGIEFVHVKMQDMTAEASPDDLLDACKRIYAFLDDPKNVDAKVYVHCKAGRSRSALLVTLYLAMYGHIPGVELTGDPKKDFDSAYEYVQTKRPQVDVGEHKSALAYTALSLFNTKPPKDKDKDKDNDDVCYSSREEYLSSLKAKDFIRQMTSFQTMAIYATEIQYYFSQCNRTNQIRQFFDDVLSSNDGSWYSQLVNHQGAIGELLKAEPYGVSLSSVFSWGALSSVFKWDAQKSIWGTEEAKADKTRRHDIVKNFITELNTHLVSMNLSILESEPRRALRAQH